MPNTISPLSQTLWDTYNQAKLAGEHLDDQTGLFFSQSALATQELNSSFNRVVHLGAGIGSFLQPMAGTRDVIGYDCSLAAVTQINQLGMRGRKVDLNNFDSYKVQLEQDLLIPTDILMIRILEYLHPEVVVLLLTLLIEQAEPGSVFYIETAWSMASRELETIGHMYKVVQGCIPSFFAARTDMTFLSWEKRKDIVEGDMVMDVERVIVKKNPFLFFTWSDADQVVPTEPQAQPELST